MTKFQVGKTYSCRSICDHNCIFSFEIVLRTPATVTITSRHGNTVRRKIRVCDDVEQIDPHGRYSMSPVLTAASEAE